MYFGDSEKTVISTLKGTNSLVFIYHQSHKINKTDCTYTPKISQNGPKEETSLQRKQAL